MEVPWAWEEPFPHSLFDLDRSDFRKDWGGAEPSLSLSTAESPSLGTVAESLLETDEPQQHCGSTTLLGATTTLLEDLHSNSFYFFLDLESMPARGPGSRIAGAQPKLMEWMDKHPHCPVLPIMFCFSASP